MFPLPKWQKCLIGHSLRNSAHSSVHALRWHFCHFCPRPARSFAGPVMNGCGILFPFQIARCAPPTPELARIPIFCPRAYYGVFVPSRGETEYRHTAAVQCARVRGALRAARCANRFDSICRLAAAGVPLLRCAARRRVRIGCGVS